MNYIDLSLILLATVLLLIYCLFQIWRGVSHKMGKRLVDKVLHIFSLFMSLLLMIGISIVIINGYEKVARLFNFNSILILISIITYEIFWLIQKRKEKSIQN